MNCLKIITLVAALQAILLLYSCGTETKKETDKETVARMTAEARQLSSGPDTVYLGFMLGWSRREAVNHLGKLVAEKKIRSKYDDTYTITVPGITEEYEGTITAGFLNDTLVEVGAGFDASSPILAFKDLGELIEQKYGAYGHMYKPVESLNYYNKHWFVGRLRIDLKMNIYGVRLNYVDTDREAAYKAYLDGIEQQKKDKVVENF